jgi:hypothetical protein
MRFLPPKRGILWLVGGDSEENTLKIHESLLSLSPILKEFWGITLFDLFGGAIPPAPQRANPQSFRFFL